jgi:hypothetical protein
MFRVVLPPIIRSAYNRIYSIWYLSHRCCYLPLSWKSWNRLQYAVGGVRHPQHTATGSNSSTIAADRSNGVTNTRCCRYSCSAPDDGWKYHPKHVEQFLDINKLCNFASCSIYIGIVLGAHYILHISRIRVNLSAVCFQLTQSRCFSCVVYVTDTMNLVGDQPDAQFLLEYVYLNPLHVPSNSVLTLRRTTV